MSASILPLGHRLFVCACVAALAACGAGDPPTDTATDTPTAAPDSTASTGTGQWVKTSSSTPVLSTFDGTIVVEDTASQTAELVGLTSALTAAETESVTASTQGLATLRLQFEGGDDSERYAKVVPDPTDAANQVLQFWLGAPNVRDSVGAPYKGRVQMNAYGNHDAHEIYLSARMYLSSDFNLVKDYPGSVGWLGISEWWNNAGWTGEPYPFRISVHIAKPSPAPGAPLLFKVNAQTKSSSGDDDWDNTIWTAQNALVAVPVGRWVTVEYYWLEGDQSHGRFYMAVTPDGGLKQVVFDIHNTTHHPRDPSPDGMSHFNPLKLYTSADLINFIRSRGGALQVFWDDIDVRMCHAGNTAVVCAPSARATTLPRARMV